ncbi:MAG: hypothetical protein ACRCZF_15875, partial [Gemmataceae bacterium]
MRSWKMLSAAMLSAVVAGTTFAQAPQTPAAVPVKPLVPTAPMVAPQLVPAPMAPAPMAAAPQAMPMAPGATPVAPIPAPVPAHAATSCAGGSCAVPAPAVAGCSTCGNATSSGAHAGLFSKFLIGAGTATPPGCGCGPAAKTFAFGSC